MSETIRCRRMMSGDITCQCNITLQTRPKVSFGLPSTMSLVLMFTNLTLS